MKDDRHLPARWMTEHSNSRGPNTRQETIDIRFQPGGLLVQPTCSRKHIGCSHPGLARRLAHPYDVARYLFGTLCHLLDAARDLARRDALLLHGRRNRDCDLVDGGYRAAHAFYRLNSLAHGALHAVRLRRDLLRCTCGLAGERLHLACYDGKPPSRLAGTRSLYGCI